MLKDAENCQIAPGFTRIVIHGMVLVQRPFSDTGLHAVRGGKTGCTETKFIRCSFPR